MSWLYLLFSVVGALLTYNLFRPTAGGARRAVLSFFVGWLWGELALHAVGFLLVGTLIFAAFGALDGWPGELGLLITILSGAALVKGYRLGLAAAPLVERALRAGFGNAYMEKIRPELREQFEDRIRWRPILRPFPIHHRDVERIRDIPFARERGATVKLDLYRNRSLPTNCPVLLQIHGGGWVVGDKREQGLPLINHLASRGWVCISTNYRLSPHATFPDHLIDVKRAIGWIRENVANYGGNPDFLVVTGGSAGGHLAAMVGLTENEPEYQPGFEHVDTRINGCMPVYGVYDFTDRHGIRPHQALTELLEQQVMKGSLEELPDEYRKASPIDRIHAAVSPFFVVHGELDTLVAVQEARHFTEALREQSNSPVVYVEVPGAQHAFELFPSLRTQAVVDGMERFATYVYSQYLDGIPRIGDEEERRLRGELVEESPAEPGTAEPAVAAPEAEPPAPAAVDSPEPSVPVRKSSSRTKKTGVKKATKTATKKSARKTAAAKKVASKPSSRAKKVASGKKASGSTSRARDNESSSENSAPGRGGSARVRSGDEDGVGNRRASGR